MRIALLALCAVTGCASFSSLKSETSIEPNKSFLLGGGQPGAFEVTGRNSGTVSVTLFVERNGKRDSIAIVPAGSAIDATFPAGAMAVVRNESSTLTAVVTVTVRGDIANLGMRYEPARR